MLNASVCMCYKFSSSSSFYYYYLEGIIVKFVYEGHRVDKAKVTGMEKVQNPNSHNVKLRSAITPAI